MYFVIFNEKWDKKLTLILPGTFFKNKWTSMTFFHKYKDLKTFFLNKETKQHIWPKQSDYSGTSPYKLLFFIISLGVIIQNPKPLQLIIRI